jgi:hypothetical protein
VLNVDNYNKKFQDNVFTLVAGATEPERAGAMGACAPALFFKSEKSVLFSGLKCPI